MKDNHGFTLIEILIVVAIIGILALVVFVTLNPLGRFSDSKNSTRIQNVQEIGKGILQYSVDKGVWPTGIPTLNNVTGTDTNGFNTATGAPDCDFANVSATNHPGCEWADDPSLISQLTPTYFTSIPQDVGTYSHFFVAYTGDGTHVVVMSASMDTNTVTTNQNHTTWYYSEI